MTLPHRAACAALAFLLAGSVAVSALTQPSAIAQQTKKPPAFDPPKDSVAMLHLQAKMRDGVRLDTSVWLPKADGKFPVVLTRTPYRTEMGAFQTKLLQQGYAVVEQHERGRYLSEGQMHMLGRADEDGWDTLEWITHQAWSNGKIATYGCSSSAENQMKLASLNHPAHKAMIVGSPGVGIAESGPHHEQGNFWRGGVWQQGWMDYFLAEMQTEWPQLPAGLSDTERTRLSTAFTVDNANHLPARALDKARMFLPMTGIPEQVGAPQTELGDYLARGPSNPAWAEDRATDKDVIKVPGLWAEALYDISSPQTVNYFETMRKANPAGSQSIIITNGQHCSFSRPRTKIGDRPLGDATLDYPELALAWLNKWMKDDKFAATPKQPVTVYMAGANRWATFPSVPMPGQGDTKTLYLSGGGKANTGAGDGVLADIAPASMVADKFRYDPTDPVISHGGQISGVGSDQTENDGAYDQRDIERRKDVLVYTSAPLTEDTAVFGYVDTQLYVASSAPDTDFTVKLVDVDPNGTAWNIADTIQRMRYRNGDARAEFINPGEVYPVKPPPMLAANVFLKGHRIRIEISSSNFPTYARNLNTRN
ncbi:MAG TPA: CocE/NonD family hydrolase, partial [Hyphomonadaceae bacterium]|nr:CocE/NonD family hydrolase [Hyphomonadaceae bacterium]